MLSWFDELATGIHEIDDQHRELLQNIACLDEATRSGNLQRSLDILSYLEGYTSNHFASEERHMASIGYPRLAEHRSLHVAFLREFQRRRALYEANRSLASLTLDLSDWLSAWLLDHVRGADADMARHLREAARP